MDEHLPRLTSPLRSYIVPYVDLAIMNIYDIAINEVCIGFMHTIVHVKIRYMN